MRKQNGALDRSGLDLEEKFDDVLSKLFGLVELARVVVGRLLDRECMALPIVCVNSLQHKFWHNPYIGRDLSCIGLGLTSVLIMQNIAYTYCSPD